MNDNTIRSQCNRISLHFFFPWSNFFWCMNVDSALFLSLVFAFFTKSKLYNSREWWFTIDICEFFVCLFACFVETNWTGVKRLLPHRKSQHHLRLQFHGLTEEEKNTNRHHNKSINRTKPIKSTCNMRLNYRFFALLQLINGVQWVFLSPIDADILHINSL